MKYYIYLNNVVSGPFPLDEIKAKLASGELTRTDKVCAEGTKNWQVITEVTGDATPGTPLPPPPPQASDKPIISDEARARLKGLSEVAKSKAIESAGLAKLFARRIGRSNFIVESASSEERSSLEKASPPVTIPSVQNYLAWRRALLWFSCVALAVVAFKESKDYITNFVTTGGNKDMPVPAVVKIWAFFLPVIGIAALFFCVRSVRRWTEIDITRRSAAIAYLAQFGGPVLLTLFPIYLFMPDIPVTPDLQPALMQLRQFGIPEKWLLKLPRYFVQGMLALNIIIVMLPKVLGLFPGVVRCSLTLKTLMPQHPLPGWLGIAVAPLFALFVIIPALVAIQVGYLMVGIGLICIAMFPLTLVYFAKSLSAISSPEQMSVTIGTIRKWGKILFIAGLLAIINGAWEWIAKIGWSNVFSLGFAAFICGFLGNILLLTVVCSDVMLMAAKASFDKERELGSSTHGNDHARRMEELTELGTPFQLLPAKSSTGSEGAGRPAA